MRAPYIAATAILLASVALSTGASAADYRQTQKFSVKDNGWLIVPTAPFQAFGNGQVGDCQYETAANLTLAEFPDTKISTNEVESAFNKFGINWVGPFWEGQRFLEFKGFGHRATISPVSSNLDYYANHGGLEVTIFGHMEHMLGIIRGGKTITVVDDGLIYNETWQTLRTGFIGDQLAFYAVKWN